MFTYNWALKNRAHLNWTCGYAFSVLSHRLRDCNLLKDLGILVDSRLIFDISVALQSGRRLVLRISFSLVLNLVTLISWKECFAVTCCLSMIVDVSFVGRTLLRISDWVGPFRSASLGEFFSSINCHVPYAQELDLLSLESLEVGDAGTCASWVVQNCVQLIWFWLPCAVWFFA